MVSKALTGGNMLLRRPFSVRVSPEVFKKADPVYRFMPQNIAYTFSARHKNLPL